MSCHSKELCEKLSVAAKLRTQRNGGKAVVNNEFSIGSKHSEEAKLKISKNIKGTKRPYKERPHKAGANSPFWKGGVSSEHMRIRSSHKSKEWRKAIFKRDNYTCVLCKKRGGRLQADHIKPFADFPELRFDLDNGRTLCIDCHRNTDTWGSKTRWKKYEKS